MAGIRWSDRLAKLLAVGLLVAMTCVALGIWQIARLHQKQQFNEAVRVGLALPPTSVDILLPDGIDPGSMRYRRAEATGTYDTDREFVLYGRTQNSQAGNHLLTPLRLAGGGAILVDRGWVPLDIDQPGAPQAAAPAGDVHVEGVLFASEGGPPGVPGRASTSGSTVSKVDLARIQSQLPYPIAQDYLLLQRQTPDQANAIPEPSPLPELSEGPHLSYAIQWFTFAAIAIVGSVVLAIRDRPDPSGADRGPVG